MMTESLRHFSKNRLSQILAHPYAFPLFAFLIPFVVRIIPEVLMGPYVVGFDTQAYYVPNTLIWLRNGVGIWNFLAVAPLLYALLMGVTAVGVPIVWSLKIFSPLLLAFLGLTVYYYANKTLSWSSKKSLLAVVFATLYFVALRISWDMFRTELALIFLFTALILLGKTSQRLSVKSGVFLSLAMVAVVFSHQLVAVIMFAIVLFTVAGLCLDKKAAFSRTIVFSAVPAALLFSVIVYANYSISSSFSVIFGFPELASSGFMALFGFNSYSNFVLNTFGFLVFCYLPLVPLLVVGIKKFRKFPQLIAWSSFIFIALVIGFISPNAFLAAFPYRWVLLLTFPLAFFAADAFANLKLTKHKAGIGLVLATLSVVFLVLPSSFAFPYFSLFSNYVPTSMVQSTIPSTDSQSAVAALNWAKSNMSNDSRLLVHDAFYGIASLTLNADQLIPYGYAFPDSYAHNLVENGSTCKLYLIWWVSGDGWHGQPTVSSAFDEVYKNGDMAVFTYNSTTYNTISSLDHQASNPS